MPASLDAATAETKIIRVIGEAAHPSFRRAPASATTRYATSIPEAFAVARNLRKSDGIDGAMVIDLAAGIHRLSRPLKLDRRDSGSVQHPLLVRGAPDGSTRILGSTPLTRIEAEMTASIRSRLPKVANGRVAVYRLPPRIARKERMDAARTHTDEFPPAVPFELFDERGALTPARWPNDGWARVAAASGDENSTTFKVTTDRLTALAGEPDLWAAGYWKWDWSFETRPILRVGPTDSTMTLSDPVTYGIAKDARYFVYHAISELDRPGEWVRTPDRRSVVLWPRSGVATGNIEASVAESLLILDDARNIRFEYITFARSRGDAIRVNGGAGIVMADCTVAWSGGRGVVFEGGGRGGVQHSTAAHTGAAGITLSAGDRRTLTPAGLFVTTTRIAHFGRLGRTYQPAIRLGGVGNEVIGNFIANGHHAAILFSGNDHVIDLNEITRVATETSDAGAIYSGRDWTARGTRIRNNFLHDIGGEYGMETKGIYLDDMASGNIVEGNLFLRVEQPVFIGGGRDNLVEGNVWIASEPGIHIDGRGTSWSKSSVEDPESELRRNLAAVPYRSAKWRARYARLAGILRDAPGTAKRNRSRLNGFIGTDLYRFEGDADADDQALGPDAAIGPESLRTGDMIVHAPRARDVGRLLSLTDLPAGWPTLPFARMDRGSLVPPPTDPVN